MLKMTPADALVAVKSFERRYTELGESYSVAEDLLERSTTPGPDGHTALDHLASAAASFRLHASSVVRAAGSTRALDSRLTGDRMVSASPDATFSGLIADAVEASGELLESVEKLGTSSWASIAQIEGAGSIDLIGLVSQAVDDGAAGLRRVRSALG